MTTEEVLGHHLNCFANGDLDGLLDDYNEESTLVTPDGVLRGPDGMRPFFEAFFAEFAKPGASFEMKQQTIDGRIAYIVWSAETADNVYSMATDTFLVEDGKISTQTLAAHVTPK
jgi:ketosteroid isomerase-like protein